MATKKKLFTDDQRRALQPVVEYCKSSIRFEEILRDQFPKLGAYYEAYGNERLKQRCEAGLEALIAAVIENTPTVREIWDSTFDHSVRKPMRDRLLKAVARAYDAHFPKAGGRSKNPEEPHRAALAKAAGLPWNRVSKRDGRFAEEDQSRNAVARDRETLVGAYLDLISVVESDAPEEIKAELERFRVLIKAASGLQGSG